MGFTEAVRTCMREKYFTFQGRASRSEYWYFYLFLFLAGIAIMAVGALLFSLFPPETGTGQGIEFSTIHYILFGIGVLLAIYLYIPMITAQVRRFHDRNLSGWWVLLVFILSNVPMVGIAVSIVALVITVLKGTDGDNKYGQDPLKVQNSADVFS